MARTPRNTEPELAAPAPVLPGGVSSMLPRRSLGLKLLLVCGLALLMSVPALMVFGLLMDRSNRAETVGREIGDLVGGPQTFLGPVIAVPYRASAQTPSAGAASAGSVTEGVWYVFPTRGTARATVDSEVRRRSLFRVTTYETALDWRATFDLSRAGGDAPAGAVLDWNRAEILLGASDARGARSDLTVNLAGREAALAPSKLNAATPLAGGESRNRRDHEGSDLKLFGAPLTAADRAGGTLEITAKARFSGAERVSLLAFAGTTQASISGDWPHPSYDGGFLPSRKPDAEGFAAEWTVPFVARGVPVEGDAGTLSRLGAADLGVSFVEPANPYQSVGRSLKYAPMFIGLVFLAYFLFETTTGRRVHPAQYILVGLAQVIFYMLLLSVAEHLGFDLAFALAASATVALISAYAGWTFDSRAQGLRALIAFTFVYGLIYVLMRLEDYALLVGALASFAAIAAVMYFTRKVDWYGVTGQDSKSVI